ncbi:MAG: glycosyl transferase family 1 [Novosphingobium sp.]|nr:glycosyl transferase family 1 [Novosphingobium sp.]
MIDRIVVINDLARAMGGASLLALQSVHAFAARGYPVTMISGDRGPEGETGHVDFVSLGQDRLLDRGLARAFVSGMYNRSARAMISEWIARNDTPGTIYHLHGWSQILSSSVFAALRPVRHRTVMSAHDFFLTCPNGAQFDYVQGEACPRTPLSLDCVTARCDRRNHVHKLWRVARLAVQRHILANGPLPLQLLIHCGMHEPLVRAGVAEQSLALLPNPITPYSQVRIAAERNRNVLFVGRMETTKGIDLAARACRAAGLRLVAVGDGALLGQLRADYPEMLFTGRLQPAEIPAHAAGARLLVMPSRHMEPFGLTAVEALWSGLPVVLSAQSLIADDIVQTGAGVAIDPEDEAEFARVLAVLAADDDLAARMSEAAFSGTSALASRADDWTDALLGIYAATLAGTPRAPAAWPASAPVATRSLAAGVFQPCVLP